MASTQEFECLVLGEEPAGLWLLQKLDKVYRHSGESPYFGWLQFEPERAATPVPAQFAEHFGLDAGPTWHTQILSKRGALEWSPESFKDRFPKLNLELLEAFPKTTHGREREFTMAHKALSQYPELLSYCMGLWKYFGRASNMRPESVVLAGLRAHTLCWWQPKDGLPKSVAPIDVTVKNRNVKEIYFSKKGMISLQLEDQTTLLTRKLILNTSFLQLKDLAKRLPELLSCIDMDFSVVSQSALYPLHLEVNAPAVSSWVPPLNFFFDSIDLPNLDEEIWPFECERRPGHASLTLWASWSRGISMEGLTAQFLKGYERLNWLFPFLHTHLERLSAPLSIHCHSQQARTALQKGLEAHAKSRFEVTRTHSSTRRPNVFFLSPSLHTQWLYPFGPMLEAQKLVREIAGGKRVRSLKKPPAPSLSPPN
ncbi:MAG: hypothetical protein KDD51_16500 [Bdellovibrionales bacterium]|nr:hypothetical protein [Bdellovibrionales bacterium]